MKIYDPGLHAVIFKGEDWYLPHTKVVPTVGPLLLSLELFEENGPL